MKRKFYFIFFILSFILILTSCKNNNYTEAEYSYKLSDSITDIEINWRVGDIEITSGDEFSIVETSQDEKAIAPLNYSIIDNKLVLNYNNSNKNLKIVLKKAQVINSLNIESNQSNLKLNNIKMSYFISNTKFGILNITNCQISNFNSTIECSHYDINISNNQFSNFYLHSNKLSKIIIKNNICESFFIEIVSTIIEFNETNKIKCLKINMIFGSILLILDRKNGYVIFANAPTILIDFETINYNGIYYYSNAEFNYNLSSKNGVIAIKRK